MSSAKRVRIFAGPNGSGKSTLFQEFQHQYKDKTGPFVNADLILKKLQETSFIDLYTYGLSAKKSELEEFKNKKDSISLIAKAEEKGYTINFQLNENCIIVDSEQVNSYESSLIAAFIRYLFAKFHKSFSYETVMSHHSKLKEIEYLYNLGYQIYFYFVCTENTEVNVSRIENRVALGEHSVPTSSVIERYTKSLEQVTSFLPYCYRAYLFDNSGKSMQLIAEFYKGDIEIKSDDLPQWFIRFILPGFNL